MYSRSQCDLKLNLGEVLLTWADTDFSIPIACSENLTDDHMT